MKLSFVIVSMSAVSQSAMSAFVPVSRESFISSVGTRWECFDCSNGIPPEITTWDYNYSTSVFGFWGGYFGAGGGIFTSGYHYSTATAHFASFMAYTRDAYHAGNFWNIHDDQRTAHVYVFDVLCATRVSILGFGQAELVATNGFRVTGNQLASGGQERILEPGRYTLRDLFVNGYGNGQIEVQVIGCLGDMNSDAQVNDADFLLFLQSYTLMLCSDSAMPAGCPADVNNDAIVDDSDFVVFGQSYDALVCP